MQTYKHVQYVPYTHMYVITGKHLQTLVSGSWKMTFWAKLRLTNYRSYGKNRVAFFYPKL